MRVVAVSLMLIGSCVFGAESPAPVEVGINAPKQLGTVNQVTGKITLKNGAEWEEVAYALLGAVNHMQTQYNQCVQQNTPKLKTDAKKAK